MDGILKHFMHAHTNTQAQAGTRIIGLGGIVCSVRNNQVDVVSMLVTVYMS